MSRASINITSSITMGGNDLKGFDHDMFLIRIILEDLNISEMCCCAGFFGENSLSTTVYRFCAEWCEKKKTLSS